METHGEISQVGRVCWPRLVFCSLAVARTSQAQRWADAVALFVLAGFTMAERACWEDSLRLRPSHGNIQCQISPDLSSAKRCENEALALS